MLDQDNLKEIKKITEEFLKKGTFSAEISVFFEDGVVCVDISGIEEAKTLIGENGQTLSEMQYLLKSIIRKKFIASGISDFFYFNLDINGYKKRKREYLKEIAHSIADEVVLTRREKILPPMPPYERRVIHLELIKRKEDVVSESVGKEPKRSVIIKPR
jgi:spoIIIJ-associated protein